MIVLESDNTTAVDSQWGPQFTQLFTARGLEGSENQSESCWATIDARTDSKSGLLSFRIIFAQNLMTIFPDHWRCLKIKYASGGGPTVRFLTRSCVWKCPNHKRDEAIREIEGGTCSQRHDGWFHQYCDIDFCFTGFGTKSGLGKPQNAT